MSNSITIPVPSVQAGMEIFWSVSCQSSNSYTVQIQDSSKTYLSQSKSVTSNGNLVVLGVGNALCTGNNLSITITCGGPNNLSYISSETQVGSPQPKIIGYSDVFCVEDSQDNDYNDVVVTVLGLVLAG